MTEEQRKRRVQAILDKYYEAMALMRDARAANRRSVSAVERVDTSMGTSIEGLRTVLDALASANYANQSAHVNVVEGDDAVDRAIGLALEASHMAIELLNDL